MSAGAHHKNPSPTTDIIIEMKDGGIVLIERNNEPRGWALPGGFIDYETMISSAASTLNVPAVGADHPAYILYTSGTTGRRRG